MKCKPRSLLKSKMASKIQVGVRNPRWRPKSKMAPEIQDGVLQLLMIIGWNRNAFFSMLCMFSHCSTFLKSNTKATTSKSWLVPLSVTGYVVFVVTSMARSTTNWGVPRVRFYQALKSLPAPGGPSAKVSLYCRLIVPKFQIFFEKNGVGSGFSTLTRNNAS